jgi:hypothetical protein
MPRHTLIAAGLVGLILTTAPAQPPVATPQGKLLSELPPPKAGEKVMVVRVVETKTKADLLGVSEVVEMTPGEEAAVTIPAAVWELDADGWFDSEGFNVTRVFPRSGLWALRTERGGPRLLPLAQPGPHPGMLAANPPRTYRAAPGDIITHVNGIAVNTYPRFVFALNSAANPRDLPVVVLDGHSGRRHLYYVTAVKVLQQ